MWNTTVREIEKFVSKPTELITTTTDTIIVEAAKMMRESGIGCLPVLDHNDNFVGVLSERDMLGKIVAENLSAIEVTVADLMTNKPFFCEYDTPIAEVEKVMSKYRIRHLPILENNKLAGMLSSRDIVAYRLVSNQATKAAAEHIAVLASGLKSFSLVDAINSAVIEIPKSFGAERSVLSLNHPEKKKKPIVGKCECALDPHNLPLLQEFESAIGGYIICDRIPPECSRCVGSGSRLIIKLAMQTSSDQDSTREQGYLCMCGSEECFEAPDELGVYKANLWRAILGANLTNAHLYEKYSAAREESYTDALTGAATRRAMENTLEKEFERCRRYERNFTVAIIDVDHFKDINDKNGHAVGDAALKLIVETLQKHVRITDVLVARYGGDEFCILMPETKSHGAKILLDRVEEDLHKISLAEINGISVSCGVAQYEKGRDKTIEDLMKRADDALYEAKRRGRDCVVESSELTEELEPIGVQ